MSDPQSHWPWRPHRRRRLIMAGGAIGAGIGDGCRR